MNTAPIEAAGIELDASGTPRSSRYGDVYHPRGGALEQARHVFLAGNDLPMRWRGRDRFVVLETGFGLGNNFLAAWQAWRDDHERCRRLHFISVEAAPPTREMFAALARDEALAPLADELARRWPPLVCSMHRLAFDDGDDGAVELLLAFGDVGAWLPHIAADVDAFFLDGFAPALNPAMWQGHVFKAMARLAAPGATAATWTVARSVRDGLAAAGFAVAIAPGSGAKREMTRARFAPRFVPQPGPRRRAVAMHRVRLADGGLGDGESRDLPIAIVGAGLAGCALAAALAEQGRSTLVLERREAIATEGSGNAGGLFHGVVHRDDGRHSRLHRAAALAAASEIGAAIASGAVRGRGDGVVRIEPRAADRPALQDTLDRLGWPADYVRAVDAAEASRLAGIRLASPAWFFPAGGWVDPQALARAWLARAGRHATLRTRTSVAAIERDGHGWRLVDRAGQVIAITHAVVLANAGAALELIACPPWPVIARRGTITSIATCDLAPAARPRRPVAGLGYVLPDIDGRTWFGASSQVPSPPSSSSFGASSWSTSSPRLDASSRVPPPSSPGCDRPRAGNADDAQVDTDDRAYNVARFAALTGAALATDARLDDRSAWRWTCADRLPLVGAVPAVRSRGGRFERFERFDRDEPFDRDNGFDKDAGRDRFETHERDPSARPLRLDQPRFVPRLPGLYVFAALGSRGIAFAALGARILAAQITGAPMPVEADLLDAIDPARFTSRAFRRATARTAPPQPPLGPIAGSFFA